MDASGLQKSFEEAKQVYQEPFALLIYKSHEVLRKHFDPTEIQVTTLLNIKSGGCPEDCAYCPQSAHYKTEVNREKLWSAEDVEAQIIKAKKNGATRFCLVTAWRSPPTKDFPKILKLIALIKKHGLESCASLGMLNQDQALQLKAVGTDYYNHNLDSSRDFYNHIIKTRHYDDRLNTLNYVATAGMHICCGGILGMGESIDDRIKLLIELTQLPKPPKVVTVNLLMPIPGTPLEQQPKVDPIEHIRFIALARILLPQSSIRLCAGRNQMNDVYQAMSFYAGANSIIAGDKYLTQSLHPIEDDVKLFEKLNMTMVTLEETV